MGILTNSAITREEFYKNFKYYENWFRSFLCEDIKAKDWLPDILKELKQVKDTSSIYDEFNRLAYERYMSICVPKYMNEGFSYSEAESLATMHLDVDDMEAWGILRHYTEKQKQEILDMFYN